MFVKISIALADDNGLAFHFLFQILVREVGIIFNKSCMSKSCLIVLRLRLVHGASSIIGRKIMSKYTVDCIPLTNKTEVTKVTVSGREQKRDTSFWKTFLFICVYRQNEIK